MTPTQDRNFDGLARRFNQRVYGGLKGRIRLAVLWRDLQAVLPPPDAERTLRVLDAGGGQGQIAQRLAEQGHEVVLCDISQEMLELADDSLRAAGVREQVELLNVPIQKLGQHVAGDFDLVLCHAVLEWLAEPEATLRGLLPLLKPAGHLSLTFYNVNGLLYKNLLRGNFTKVKRKKLAGMGNHSLTPPNPLHPGQVLQWLDALPLQRLSETGVRVLYDFMRDLDLAEVSDDELLDMELTYSQEAPFRDLGRYYHVLAAYRPNSLS